MRIVLMAALAVLCSDAASAGNLKYQPQNPSFGGSSLNGSVLLGQAGAQNKYAAEESQRSSASSLLNQTPAQRFAATFQQRLLSSVADNITDSILGPNARESGRFQIDGTTIQFQREGNNVNLTINDGVNQTSVIVPVSF
ncbi:curli assembly protein CsgF [Aureimonas pseudogalii]|uniref:Curli production assembly/transport component CsgF n=1 Tax=Aureimonas pseudogalii TaxID=1744844 RepID=A0A7W6H7U1_9HYPH|nr:curli assembly protein CsgF [Aureimonas pseudogalii]MBB4000220.1 curli production assembly/transport component CsgF [Aureimonas pseudogalii]